MANTILGWDIGGAHLKSVLIDDTGRVLRVWQLACPLWQGLDKLSAAIEAVRYALDEATQVHAVTMTGELADIFPDRKSGVRQITQLMVSKFDNLRFYAGSAGFVEADEIATHLEQIASANWFASAEFLAHQVGSALFVDIGSTTADLVPLHDGRVQNKGYSDAERMQHDELVYTGVIRTPLMALGSHVPFAGGMSALAAEHFATTADIYRLTGELQEEYDLAVTADGTDKTLENSTRRIARMICRDLDEAPLEQWKALAFAFRQLQLDRLGHAALQLYSRHFANGPQPLIGAGAGSFLTRALAKQLGKDYLDAGHFVTALTPELSQSAAICFPAYAVARLALESVI